MVGRLIRNTTAISAATIVTATAVIYYRHAYELASAHDETGVTAGLRPSQPTV